MNSVPEGVNRSPQNMLTPHHTHTPSFCPHKNVKSQTVCREEHIHFNLNLSNCTLHYKNKDWDSQTFASEVKKHFRLIFERHSNQQSVKHNCLHLNIQCQLLPVNITQRVLQSNLYLKGQLSGGHGSITNTANRITLLIFWWMTQQQQQFSRLHFCSHTTAKIGNPVSRKRANIYRTLSYCSKTDLVILKSKHFIHILNLFNHSITLIRLKKTTRSRPESMTRN